MTELEYEILDELYFLTTFDQLMKKLNIDGEKLKSGLGRLFEKGWIRVLEKQIETDVENLDFFYKNYKNYNYLASKAGLIAHNSR